MNFLFKIKMLLIQHDDEYFYTFFVLIIYKADMYCFKTSIKIKKLFKIYLILMIYYIPNL